MVRPDERARDRELRERLSRLSEASLRINKSLDPDTVLQEVMENARSLTGARWSGITTVDSRGRLVDFITAGVTPEEHGRMLALAEGPRLFDYLASVEGPIRLRDAAAYMRSQGFPEGHPPVKTFMGAKMRHGGEHVGNLYVAEKEGGKEFTVEDEEVLVMFATQAALVVSNARRHQEVQKAKTNLETLINTSPVGVAVFDARTGAPVSFNREAARIVDSLREPGQSTEQLLEVVTCVRADGRELSLEEMSMAEALSAGETVQAEEIVIRAPNGRGVRALLNATPIRSDDGEVDSFIVTLQDMTQVEELERLRAKFLGMVSHELRMPLATIKGSTTTLLSEPDLDPAVVTQFLRIADQQVDHIQEMIGDLLDAARIQTGTLPVDPVHVDVAQMVDEAVRRFVGGGGRSNLHINLAADLPPAVADRRRIVQVIVSLLSNAASNSPEESPIRVAAVREGVHIAVSVADAGRGILSDDLPRLFQTLSRVEDSDRGGGGLGAGLALAVCKGIVEAHGGRIWVEKEEPDLGTRFTFTIPASEAERVEPPVAPTSTNVRSHPFSGKQRILAVDDDPQALRYIRDAISKAGYVPIVTGDPDDVLSLVVEEKPHLVLLDLMLPGTDGIELMKDILKETDIPVIFVSMYGQELVVSRAFDMGAADYVVKPFSPTELGARIRAALRKWASPYVAEPSEPYAVRDLRIAYAERRVWMSGRPVTLTPLEYGVLYELSLHAGRAVTHDQLLQNVWGPGKRGEPWLVREVVKRLRRKLGDDANSPAYIHTEPRIGYRMAKSRTPDSGQ